MLLKLLHSGKLMKCQLTCASRSMSCIGKVEMKKRQGASHWQGTVVTIGIIFAKSFIFNVKLLLKCLR